MRRVFSLFIIGALLLSLVPVPVKAQTNALHILSRQEWGADESFLVQTSHIAKQTTVSESNERTSEAISGRQDDCKQMYARYPSEFNTSTMVTENAKGQKLLWPQNYSPSVRLLVVHHTALKVMGETRSGAERMRALYQYHAQNKGWGDIGYHFVIDEQGQVYEGRAGGDSVIGGHVYCNNVGTIGIAMMGNFDIEQPTQVQVQSLQALLKLLADKYHLDLSRKVLFHGKELPVIVGHRQLLSTDCPGLMMWSVLDQVRDHVRSGDVDASVEFPDLLTPAPATEQRSSLPKIVTGSDGLAALTETVIEGRPGGEIILPIFFRAQRKSYVKNTRIARITRTGTMELWQERDGVFEPIRGDVKIPVPLVREGESVMLRLKVRLPADRGTAALKVGSVNYRFEISGKRVRTRQLLSTTTLTQLPENSAPTQQSRVTLTSPLSSSSTSDVGAVRERPLQTPTIRIRLSPRQSLLNVTCSSIQISSSDGITRIDGFFPSPKSYRGSVECRSIDGEPALINELPMEDYLAGLTEEPDSEPYEKQRAFAIAARTYATFYLASNQRKFPGKPYDGSDDPAIFQAYGGYEAELRNPKWVRAVNDTANQVLTYRGTVIKPPYFSSDDGQTRTPQQAGWNNFPFAEIFTSKDDHWCAGMSLRGHGVGMSGCGAEAQANEGKSAEQILSYYYPGTVIDRR